MEVQQIDGGTVTLPSSVLDNQKSKNSSHRGSSSSRHRRSGGSRDRSSRHRSSDRSKNDRHRKNDRHSPDQYRDVPYDYRDAILNQKSTHV